MPDPFNNIYNAYGDNLTNGNVLYNTQRVGGTGGFLGIGASPAYTQFSLNQDGLKFLGSKGFDTNMLADKGFQQYAYNQGMLGTTQSGGLNVLQSPETFQNAYSQYQAGLNNGTINAQGLSNNSLAGYQPIGDKGAMINTQNSNWGINADGQKTFLGGTGYQWAGVGLNTAFGLFNAYQSYQSQKLAREQFEDQKRLNHANYRMQASAFNNNLRNQQSGRGYIGMSGTAKRTLGAEYQTRKAENDY